MAKIKAVVTVTNGIANDDTGAVEAAQQAADRQSATPVKGLRLITRTATGFGTHRLHFEGTGTKKPTPIDETPGEGAGDNPTPSSPEGEAWSHPARASHPTSDSAKPSSEETGEQE